jgi:hypothetical protein
MGRISFTPAAGVGVAHVSVMRFCPENDNRVGYAEIAVAFNENETGVRAVGVENCNWNESVGHKKAVRWERLVEYWAARRQ